MGVLLEGGEKAKEGKDGFTWWDLEEYQVLNLLS